MKRKFIASVTARALRPRAKVLNFSDYAHFPRRSAFERIAARLREERLTRGFVAQKTNSYQNENNERVKRQYNIR